MKNPIVSFGVRRAVKKLARSILALGLFLGSWQNLLASYPNNVKDEEDEALSSAESGSTGLTSWQVSQPYINLWLFNQPLTYQTSYGQMAVDLAFKQRDNRAATYAFGFGSGWESSWLSYVCWTKTGSNSITLGATFMPLGGQRNYVSDGATKEIKSASTMSVQYDGAGNVATFTINNPDGSKLIYGYRVNISGNDYYAFLANQIDPVGHTNTFYYDTTNSVARLVTALDADGKANTIRYTNSSFITQITEIENPYGIKALFSYDSSGRLTNIVNVGSLASSFVYDAQGLPTNSITPYGTTRFKTTTNAFAPYNLGGTNQVNRSVEITYPEGSKELFLYRDQSTKLNPSSSTDLLPSSYPSGEVPSTSPLTNTLDNTWIDARNSFHWDRKQYSGLSSTFQTSGLFTDLTLGDYKLVQISHWLRGPNNETNITQFLSLYRGASPDGTVDGQKIWYDYAGKNGSYPVSRGTNASPSFTALVLPNGTTRFAFNERLNAWEKPTKTISTYSIPSGVGTRTNTFTYTSDGIDVVEARGPSNELLSSNAYNGFHQVVTAINGVNDVATYMYDSGRRLTNSTLPTGLVISNYYFTAGNYAGWLDKTINVMATNSFTYNNGLPCVITDPLGLCTTNTCDNLMRVATQAQCDGTISNTYSNLDLTQVVDKTTTNVLNFLYNNVDQLIQATDPRTNITKYAYCGCGAVTYVTNALQQVTRYDYDYNGREIAQVLADNTVLQKKYDLLGQLTIVIDGAGNSTTNVYNNQGLLAAVSNAFGRVQQAQYDVRDRATNSINADGVSISTTYDNLDRVLSNSFPDGGVEQYQYSAAGLIAYTNQTASVTRYAYDVAGRKIREVNPNNETNTFSYNAVGNLVSLTDGKNASIRWEYDQFDRVTNMIDATSASIMHYSYDQDGRLTNRWSAGRGNTGYFYDGDGNLTFIDYPHSNDVSFAYDALNRVTSIINVVGTNTLAYTANGALQSEDGPWDNDTVTYGYTATQMRSSLSLSQPNASPWVQTYGYDTANRVKSIASPAGVFAYGYPGPGLLVNKLSLPNGAYITNTFDSVARLTGTFLKNDQNVIINSHSYSNNLVGQITRQTRTAGDYADYTYDSAGQLKSATGRESGGGLRLHEKYGYVYDAAGNLNYRTNNALVQTFAVDTRNQLTNASRQGTLTVAGSSSSAATSVSVNSSAADRYADNTFAKDGFSLANGTNTFTAVGQDGLSRSETNTSSINLPATVNYTYDANGNLTSDGNRTFEYDDENQLTAVMVSGAWRSEFAYDGAGRRRLTREYSWQGSWTKTNEIRYIYDGNMVVQERDSNNLPLISYTRGLDVSKTLQGAGGIGGLLARTDASFSGLSHAFYHADRNGNITALINEQEAKMASYLYDAFGNVIAKNGPLADRNKYQFSSKEIHQASGLLYFGLRFYDPNLQRWLTRDPAGTDGGVNLHEFTFNSPINVYDPDGARPLQVFPDLREQGYLFPSPGKPWSRPFNSEVPTSADYALYAVLKNLANNYAWKYPNASKTFLHYVDRSGSEIQLPVDRMLRESTQSDWSYIALINRMIQEALQFFYVFPHENAYTITSTWQGAKAGPGPSDNLDARGWDWWLTIGSYMHAATMLITRTASHQFTVKVNYYIDDWYDFNDNMTFSIPDVPKIRFPDSLVSHLHVTGLAQSFHQKGSFSTAYTIRTPDQWWLIAWNRVANQPVH